MYKSSLGYQLGAYRMGWEAEKGADRDSLKGYHFHPTVALP